MFIKRYSKLQRLFHLWILVTFLNQAGTGFSRTFITTAWGKGLSNLFGGYETALFLHKLGGILLTAGFLAHIIYLIIKIDRKNLKKSIFGPDSIVPNLEDARHLWQQVLWLLRLGSPPKFDRWAYYEKFGYWGVFWGVPLLASSGILLMYQLEVTRIIPGWTLNIALLLHRDEAILAIAFLFIVHFFFGHLSPAKFPLNEAMFSGSIELEEAMEEKPVWVERLKKEGKLELLRVKPPVLWYRVLYYIFGWVAFGFGIYLLINIIVYSRHIGLH